MTVERAGATIITRHELADAMMQITAHGTIHEWAAAQQDTRVLQGRLPAYAVTLPFDGPPVVVRRNHHGGWLAHIRGDRFFARRMPYELFASLILLQAGVPTAAVVAHATYRINALERRIDVVTLELPAGRDFGAALLEDASHDVRTARWAAVTRLLDTLAAKGVWHQDLNVKNIYLIEPPDTPPLAVLLDVDRVRFHPPGALVARANASRLVRSLRKWRDTRGAAVSAQDLRLVTSAASGA